VLLPQLEAKTVIADKGFDADKRVLDPLKQAVKEPSSRQKQIETRNESSTRNSSKRRKLLRQTQTLPRHRHPIRQNNSKRPRCHLPRSRNPLAQSVAGNPAT